MQVHRQRCQACGSLDLRNILLRREGKRQAVLVRCARCRELVARYELSAYYHHGKGFESFLRHLRAEESGRQTGQGFDDAKTTALEDYAAALDQLAREGKDI